MASKIEDKKATMLKRGFCSRRQVKTLSRTLFVRTSIILLGNAFTSFLLQIRLKYILIARGQ